MAIERQCIKNAISRGVFPNPSSAIDPFVESMPRIGNLPKNSNEGVYIITNNTTRKRERW